MSLNSKTLLLEEIELPEKIFLRKQQKRFPQKQKR